MMAMMEITGPRARRLVSSISRMAMPPMIRSVWFGEETRNIA
jgi:hypothetical protein